MRNILIAIAVFFCFSAKSQDIIGFQGFVNTPLVQSGDTLKLTVNVIDFSSQATGLDLNNWTDTIAVWQGCERYPVVVKENAFGSQIDLWILASPSQFSPGYCVVIGENLKGIGGYVAGIDDSKNQCMLNYYIDNLSDLLEGFSGVDSVTTTGDTISIHSGGQVYKVADNQVVSGFESAGEIILTKADGSEVYITVGNFFAEFSQFNNRWQFFDDVTSQFNIDWDDRKTKVSVSNDTLTIIQPLSGRSSEGFTGLDTLTFVAGDQSDTNEGLLNVSSITGGGRINTNTSGGNPINFVGDDIVDIIPIASANGGSFQLNAMIDTNDVTGLGDFVSNNTTETDPVYSAWDKDYNDLTNKPITQGIYNYHENELMIGTTSNLSAAFGVLGTMEFNYPTVGTVNFISGTNNGDLITTGANNVIYGSSNIRSANATYNFCSGILNANSATTVSNSILNGEGNARAANQVNTSLLSGNYNVEDADLVRFSNIVGYRNYRDNTGDAESSLIVGYLNGSGTTAVDVDQATVVGLQNVYSHTDNVTALTALGIYNARNATTVNNGIYIGQSNGRYNSGPLNHSILLGFEQGYSSGVREANPYRLAIGMYRNTPLLYGEFDNEYLEVLGNMQVVDSLGIGTSAPGHDLDVQGAIGFGATATATQPYLDHAGGGNAELVLPGTSGFNIENTANASFRLLPSFNDIYFQNNLSTGGMRFTGAFGATYSGNTIFNTTGNVGIGTTSPSGKVDITTDPFSMSTINPHLYLKVGTNNWGQGNYSSGIVFGSTHTGNNNTFQDGSAIFGIQGTSDIDNVGLGFAIRSNSNNVNRTPAVSILGKGTFGDEIMMGVNTMNPNYTLDVDGNGYFSNKIYPQNGMENDELQFSTVELPNAAWTGMYVLLCETNDNAVPNNNYIDGTYHMRRSSGLLNAFSVDIMLNTNDFGDVVGYLKTNAIDPTNTFELVELDYSGVSYAALKVTGVLPRDGSFFYGIANSTRTRFDAIDINDINVSNVAVINSSSVNTVSYETEEESFANKTIVKNLDVSYNATITDSLNVIGSVKVGSSLYDVNNSKGSEGQIALNAEIPGSSDGFVWTDQDQALVSTHYATLYDARDTLSNVGAIYRPIRFKDAVTIEHGNSFTVDVANDEIDIDKTGWYEVEYNISFTSDTDAEFSVAVLDGSGNVVCGLQQDYVYSALSFGTMSSSNIANLLDTDVLSLEIKVPSGLVDIDNINATLKIRRIR
jgi:hypothetical protein